MFEHFEHKADIGIRGKGSTIEHAFEEAAKALTQIMASVECVEPKKAHTFEVKATDRGALLVSFLNELLFLKDTKKMLYSKFRTKITSHKNSSGEETFVLKATVFGEKIDSKKHSLKVDPKAATYSELLVEKKGNEWIAQCIIDV
ncbi:MAG: archease [archaeon]|jgi:SHS2 domain-containing protein